MARLLIVGDAPESDLLVAVANDGHDVTHAPADEDAHRLFAQRRFDVVVLLATRPVASSWRKQFRAACGQTPVLVITRRGPLVRQNEVVRGEARRARGAVLPASIRPSGIQPHVATG